MKTLTIRGLPSELHANLKQRAKRNRRSLNQEVIAELAGVGQDEEREVRVRRLIDEAERIAGGIARPLSGDEIVEAIQEGRR